MREYSEYLDEMKLHGARGFKYSLNHTTPFIPELGHALDKIDFIKEESRRGHILNDLKNKIIQLSQCGKKSNCYITMGATQAIFQVVSTLTNRGDYVLLERPYYEPFQKIMKFLDLNIVYFERNKKADYDCIKEIVSRHNIKLVLFTNPHFFHGYVLNDQELNILNELDVPVILDEIYLPYFTKNKITSINENLKNIISISGLSKTLGLSSLRIGSVLCFKDINIERSGLILHTDMPTLSLVAACKVIDLWDEIINKNKKDYIDVNRTEWLRMLKDCELPISHDFSRGHIASIEIPDSFATSFDFKRLVEHRYSIEILTGDHFGVERRCRISLIEDPIHFKFITNILRQLYYEKK